MPEWAESKECGICRTKFTLTNRRHHCRCCGKSFCKKCSSKEVPIPKFGVEKPVRVCDFCYEQETGKDAHDTVAASGGAGAGTGAGGTDASDLQSMQKLAMQNQNLTPEQEVALAIERDRSLAASAPKQAAAAGGSSDAKAREQELKEREEMELAMALSMSEAESAKPQQQSSRQMPVMHQNYDYLEASAPEPSPSPAPSASSVYGSAFAEMQSHVEDPADTYQPVVAAAAAALPAPAPAPAPVARAAVAQPQVTFQPPAELQAHYEAEPEPAAAIRAPARGQAYELDYTVGNPLANEQDQTQLKSVQSGLALFELKLNRAATRGLGIQNNVEIQALLRSLSLMHPDLLARAGQLGDIKEKHEALREKYREIKAARQRYDFVCLFFFYGGAIFLSFQHYISRFISWGCSIHL